MVEKSEGNLSEIASVFFKLGCIAFGGPAAHIALMEAEIVSKRKWLSRQRFLDLMGATNLIPGPNSTELTMHCGYERGGWKGLFVAGICFIFPAVAITGILAWFYTSYGELPEIKPFIQGITPAVLVVILEAILKLGKKALKTKWLYLIAFLVFISSILGVNEIYALLSAGMLAGVFFASRSGNKSLKNLLILALPLSASHHELVLSQGKIFLSFLKVGAILYGSGYVLFAYLDAELVVPGYLSRPDLLEAIAVGQFTPGPVLSTATFIGWQLGGWQGALAATAGIFLPSFLFVLLLNPLVDRMRKSTFLSGFLDGVNAAAVAVM
ncbi:MAG: chromate efflux transporter, partial [Flavobacteriales bacterium]|nr:chromate efflux transporter [Flavobacteriales bacterium]